MKRVTALSVILTAVILMTGPVFCEEQSYYAVISLRAGSPDAYKEKAISMAKEICDKERLAWEDITVRKLGDSRWRVTVTSLEQGKTLVVEINAKDEIVLSKVFK